MFRRCNTIYYSNARQYLYEHIRSFSQDLHTLRNIGILAHIDAGKTTTTERLLFMSGKIKSTGEVHDGVSVMDFTLQERTRGITINSAAISFIWKSHTINLIDTPGHVDFTIEVERAVRVLDGAVVVFDGVAGVEAQSEKVWKQADAFQVPRLAFINKMDRPGANYQKTIHSISDKFNVLPLVIQIPLEDDDDVFKVLDLVNMELLEWKDEAGKELKRWPLLNTVGESKMSMWYRKANDARTALIENVAEVDDVIAEMYLTEEDIDSGILQTALRRVTMNKEAHAVIVLCGSALKNRGIQPLLDSIVQYLPSPIDAGPVVAQDITSLESVLRHPSSDEPLCALIFKVILLFWFFIFYQSL